MDELLIVAVRVPPGVHPRLRELIERHVDAVGADRQASFAAGPVAIYAEGRLRDALHTLGIADDRLIEDDGRER